MAYRIFDGNVSSATAEAWRLAPGGKGFADFRVRWVRLVLQELGCFDHHAALAEAAKRDLLFDPGELHGMKRFFRLILRQVLLNCPAGGQSFQSGDLLTHRHGSGSNAGANLLAVDQYGTRAALREATPELWAVYSQLIPQYVEKGRVLWGCYRKALAIYGQVHHRGSPFSSGPKASAKQRATAGASSCSSHYRLARLGKNARCLSQLAHLASILAYLAGMPWDDCRLAPRRWDRWAAPCHALLFTTSV